MAKDTEPTRRKDAGSSTRASTYSADFTGEIGPWELARPLVAVVLVVMALMSAIMVCSLLPGSSLDGPLRSVRELVQFTLVYQAVLLWMIHGFRLRWWDMLAASILAGVVCWTQVFPVWQYLLPLCLPILVSAVFAGYLSTRTGARNPAPPRS